MNEKTIASRCAFEGCFLRVDTMEVETASGRRTRREVVRHPGAVAVLAQLPDDRFVFVRQFRKAVERSVLEIVAGTREPDEGPRDCAIRELAEEAGVLAADLDELGVFLSAPGYTDEQIELYYARVEPLAAGPTPEDDEDIEVVCLSEAEVEQRIDSVEIVDGKTLAAWLLHNRRR